MANKPDTEASASSTPDAPGYLIQIQKVTSLSGESIQVSFNMAKASTVEDIDAEIVKLCEALDRRLVQQNEKVLEITRNTRAALESFSDEQPANGKLN